MTMLATATTKNKSGFYIGVGCPGCGGELSIDSELFVIGCNHCGSSLRITMPDIPPAFMAQAKVSDQKARFNIDRHLKEKNHPLTGSGLHYKHLYYPYWKIDSIKLKLRNRIERRKVVIDQEGNTESTVEKHKTEISLSPNRITMGAGGRFDGIPDAIGMRADYLHLTPYSRVNTQDGYDSLPVVRSWDDVWQSVIKRARGLGEMDMADFGTNRTEVFRPIASLIYFPFIVVESYAGNDYNRYVVDGVTGRVLEHLEEPPSMNDPLDAPPLVEFGQLGIGFHRCGNCGFDLPSKQSYVYVCDNCHQMTCLDDHAVDVSNLSITRADISGNDSLFPFWSFQIGPDAFPQLKRLFGGIYQSDRLVIPAFRLRSFDANYRLSKRMSAARPQFEFDTVDSFEPSFQLVSLSMTEALVMARIMIFRAELDRGVQINKLALGEFNPLSADLFFAPFHPESYFFVDSVLQSVTFEKNALD